jgi:hypothetical protein
MSQQKFIDVDGDGKDDETGETRTQHSNRLATEQINAKLDTLTSNYLGTGSVLISPGQKFGPSTIVKPVVVTTTEAKKTFEGKLLTRDADALAIGDWMYKAGLISISPSSGFAGVDQAVKIYNRAVDYASAAYSVGDVNKSVLDFLSMVPGSNGPGAGGSSTSKQIQSYTPAQARDKAINAYRAILGRSATEQEITEFTNGLINSAKNTPSVQKVSSKGGATVQETTQGFDEKTWTLGFMAGKIGEGDLAGSSGVAQDAIKAMAQKYGINLSTQLAYDLVGNLVQGQTDEAGAEQVFKEQAKIMYPHLSEKIDAGFSPRQMADPYINNTMNILEKSSTEADMFSPYIKEALSYKDQNGVYVLPTADEHARMLRGKDEWLQTRNGKESLMSAADNILKQMGFE